MTVPDPASLRGQNDEELCRVRRRNRAADSADTFELIGAAKVATNKGRNQLP
jgi:hypothetical protein